MHVSNMAAQCAWKYSYYCWYLVPVSFRNTIMPRIQVSHLNRFTLSDEIAIWSSHITQKWHLFKTYNLNVKFRHQIIQKRSIISLNYRNKIRPFQKLIALFSCVNISNENKWYKSLLTKNVSSITWSPKDTASMFIERYLCARSFFRSPQLPTSLSRWRSLVRFLTGSVVDSPGNIAASVVADDELLSFGVLLSSLVFWLELPVLLVFSFICELVGDGGGTFW